MPSEVRQKKNMEKLNRAQNAQFWGLKTWGEGGTQAPRAPPGSAPGSIVNVKSCGYQHDFLAFLILV